MGRITWNARYLPAVSCAHWGTLQRIICPLVRLRVMNAEVTVDEMTCASVLWISLCQRGGSGNAGRRVRACDRVYLFLLQES